MPREQVRKRGKRKTKTDEDYVKPKVAPQPEQLHSEAGPSSGPSFHPARAALIAGHRPPPAAQAEEEPTESQQVELGNPNFPFGELDPDLKGYFRTVEDQIKDWEGVSSVGEEREDRQTFLSSVLSELRNNELLAATDPETSIVLERLLPSMGDWGRRVIGDAFGDQWETLIRHRFGSHVVQTWLTLAGETLDREARDIYPPQHHKQQKDSSEGVLPTMSSLVATLVESIMPSLPSLISDPHASPPVRLLLLVLSPNRELPSLEGGDDRIRSKKSDKFRKKQEVKGKSIFGDDMAKLKGKAAARRLPADIRGLRRKIREALMGALGEGEWKIVGGHQVGSIVVQMMLDFEAEDGEAEKEGSLFNILTEGLVSQLDKKEPLEARPFLTSLVGVPTGTHLFEALLQHSPQPVFEALWTLYFRGKIGKLAVHPFANFVVAKGVNRLGADGVESACAECKAVNGGKGMIKSQRTSVLHALAERVAALGEGWEVLNELLFSSLGLSSDDHSMLVPCLMTLKTLSTYKAISTGEAVQDDDDDEAVPAEVKDVDAEEAAAAAARRAAWQNRRNARQTKGGLEPNLQGCVLLQSLVKIPTPGSEPVLNSLLAQDAQTLLGYATSPIGSRLLDAVLETPSVPVKYKRKLMIAFVGHYTALATDRIGSRVVERLWDGADLYLKERITKSVVNDATMLGNDPFGRYIVKRMNLYLYSTRPLDWKTAMARQAASAVTASLVAPSEQKQSDIKLESTNAAPVAIPAPVKGERKEKKRKHRPAEEKDAIDDLFASVDKPKKSKTKKVQH